MAEAEYVVAVDVGGTCTDCVIYCAGEPMQIGKAFSTPPNFAAGIIDAVKIAAEKAGLRLDRLLSRTGLFLHGSTVVDNTIITRDGSRTGLITTAGFEDTLVVTRGAYGRWSGQPEDVIKRPVATTRPVPLVPRARIFGVKERIDKRGNVILSLHDGDVESAVHGLVTRHNVQAIAVCLLWAFRNPIHENRVREIVRRLAPEIYVSISSEVAPVVGEYERTSTTVINAYAGDVTKTYLDDLSGLLAASGYRGHPVVMQGYGGLIPIAEAAVRPVGMIECGPAAGVIGAQYMSRILDETNVIAADMGGTTFKVSVIQNGEFDYAREPIVDRLHYVANKIDVASIGSGGGSIVSVDPRTRRPLIGPASAGAVPGPVCYGRGGDDPTLTDVAAIIGYMDPNTFLGGTITLDIEKARLCFEKKVAEPLGMEVEKAAIGIFRVAAAKIADLIREVTIERGLDPRGFDIHAFGGSGGLFAGAFAKELAVKRVVIPAVASVNCAFGMVTADVVHEYSSIEPMSVPAAPDAINAIFAPMLKAASAQLARQGFAKDRTRFEWSVDMRYGRQVHQVTTPLKGNAPFDENAIADMVEEFERLYERRFGKGSAFRAAGIELVRFRLRARGLIDPPRLLAEDPASPDPANAQTGSHRMYDDGTEAMVLAPTYDFARLRSGNVIRGPAVIHSPITTIVIQSRQTGRLDPLRNLIVEMAA